MSTYIFQFARFALAAVCAFAASAGVALSMQAYAFLVESQRINAALMVGSVSVALLLASGLLVFGRRGGLLAALVSGFTMLAVVVLGLLRLGGISLHEALLQASCAPGYGLCFNQATTVVRLCIVLVVGCIALEAFRRHVSMRGT